MSTEFALCLLLFFLTFSSILPSAAAPHQHLPPRPLHPKNPSSQYHPASHPFNSPNPPLSPSYLPPNPLFSFPFSFSFSSSPSHYFLKKIKKIAGTKPTPRTSTPTRKTPSTQEQPGSRTHSPRIKSSLISSPSLSPPHFPFPRPSPRPRGSPSPWRIPRFSISVPEMAKCCSGCANRADFEGGC